jgi:hypothetical protein
MNKTISIKKSPKRMTIKYVIAQGYSIYIPKFLQFW